MEAVFAVNSQQLLHLILLLLAIRVDAIVPLLTHILARMAVDAI
jgi:hypothetical protein